MVSIFRCFLKRFLLTLAQLSSSETLFLLKLSSVCNLSRRVHYFLNKQTWNLFRLDYLSRPLKAVILFVAVPMIFFKKRVCFYLALSGLRLHATGLMDNADNVITTVADQWEGLPLIFRPKWSPKGRKRFFLETSPPYLRVWMIPHPPLYEALDPPLNNKLFLARAVATVTSDATGSHLAHSLRQNWRYFQQAHLKVSWKVDAREALERRCKSGRRYFQFYWKMIGHFFGFTKQLERMWLEHWGGALCDETKTAERETRLRGVY